MIKRLRIKFICVNMLIVTVMLAIIFVAVFDFTAKSMERESVRMLQMQVHEREPRPGPRGMFMTVRVSSDGEILERKGEDFDLAEEQISQLVLSALEGKRDNGVLEEYDLRYCSAPIREGIKIVFADTSFERHMMTNLVEDGLLIGLGSLAVFFVISLLLSRWAIKPVERAWTQQRQFVADASHELKTPLTVILTNAELLQMKEYGPEEKQVFSENILTMSKQMRDLVENMLKLAKVDHDEKKEIKQRVCLSELISSAALSFEVLFYEKGLTLESNIEPDVFMHTSSEQQLRQVAEILLDNAMKYSLPGETTISLQSCGSCAKITVSNPGEPISPENLQNIFKRFYRVDEARTINGSYGLGLAIAEQVVEKHGGKISAESENGMNTFTVIMPTVK